MNRQKLRKYLQNFFLVISAILNSLLPVIKEVHPGQLDNSYVLAFNVVCSICVALSLRSQDIIDSIEGLFSEIGEIKSGQSNAFIQNFRNNLPSSIPPIPSAREEEKESAEPISDKANKPAVVEMNAYYYPAEDRYDITPRPKK